METSLWQFWAVVFVSAADYLVCFFSKNGCAATIAAAKSENRFLPTGSTIRDAKSAIL